MFSFLVVVGVAATSALAGSVKVKVPVSGQLPLIARVNQHYKWTVSSQTFVSSEGPLVYSASSLPDWLFFDPGTLTFYGTPTAEDEGNPEITLTAHDSNENPASSTFTICVTPYPAPKLVKPLSEQLYAANPSLSSVFLLSPHSAITSRNPALRIPPGWSFSIGFLGSTYQAQNSLYYEARQADGSPLPDWVSFSPKTVTFNGVSITNQTVPLPHTLNLALHATDQMGYTADLLPFDLVVAEHELSLSSSSLPTINVTAATAFNISLASSADFSGVLVDSKPIHPKNVSSFWLEIPTSASWLHFDHVHRVLSGTPPAEVSSGPILPVVIKTEFNQSISTNVSIAVFPSFFTQDTLPSYSTGTDRAVGFDLTHFFSNHPDCHTANVTVSFEPTSASDFLHFDEQNGMLTGQLPQDQTDVVVTFTAYSHITHSTSHTKLAVTAPPSDGQVKAPGNLGLKPRKSLYLGLTIGLGIFGGMIALGGCMALLRRWTRIKDTALVGEEGMSAWTARERKWYGLDDGTPEPSAGTTDQPKAETPAIAEPRQAGRFYGSIGRGFRKVSQFSLRGSVASPASPGVMKKVEFMGKVRQVVRQVSDKMTGSHKPSPPKERPAIGKPILITTNIGGRVEGLPYGVDNPFEPIGSYAASSFTGVTNSPTNSTDARSIPRRRPDFETPRATVHFEDSNHSRQGSDDSLTSNGSVTTHATEAVVMTATRTPSIRSARSVSALSHTEFAPKVIGPRTLAERPRLVPANDARVPVPSIAVTETPRVVSQKGEVIYNNMTNINLPASGSGDDLSMGVHYVQTLGADVPKSAPGNDSPLTVFAGQRCKFKLLISNKGEPVEVRLTNGKPLPGLLYGDLSNAHKGFVEFSCAPTSKDVALGEISVGIYVKQSGACVGKQTVIVVPR